jgi:hypothetical protein
MIDTSAGNRNRGVVALRSACVALALFSASAWLEPTENAAALSERNTDETMTAQARGNRDGHLNIDASIRDLLGHAAFAGFGRLILPWDDRTHDETLRLRNIGALLPYHSHVNPGDVVAALNRMIDDASNGNRIFYDVYTGAQKQQQPARENTGLFFFRGKPGAPFAVISPGGGFTYVGSVHEGFPSVMERRIAALRQAGTEVEYHKFGNLGHGAEGWIDDAMRFWEKVKTKRK